VKKSWYLGVLALVLMHTSMAMAQSRKTTTTLIEGDTMYTLMEPGGIPAIFDPEFADVQSDAGDFDADEPMLVIAVGDEVRAYSTWHLDHHEVVNDRIGDTPLAVTW
jgi:hypothetical protein